MSIEHDKTVTVKPEYLTLDFYETILQNALGIKTLKILKVQCSAGSSTGENYCSQIFRSKIFYKTANQSENSEANVVSVIIKSMPPSSADFLESLEVYMKEKTIYYNILPRLKNLYKNRIRFSPRIYHCLVDPVKTLVFEDLNALGFKLTSRETGLDESHSRLTLKRLAQFHASSMVLAEDPTTTIKDIKNGMLAPVGLANEEGMLLKFFGSNFKALLAMVENWPGYEDIARKLRKYQENFHDNLIACQADSDKDTFRVLNHGDLWVNNLLYKYDSNGNEPVDVMFLDYQMSYWGSPGADLNYFFYTSLKLDLIKYKRYELLEHYHKELAAALEQINARDMIPTFEQVKMEFENRAANGFFASYGIFPVISMDKESSADSSLDNLADADFAQKKSKLMFQSKRLQETFRYTLKEWDKQGLWD